MKKKGYIILFVVACFLLLATTNCKQNKIKSDESHIRLDERLGKEVVAKLSLFADSVSYIFLETKDECLLPARSSIIHIDAHDIFVRGENFIYRFSSNGAFKNKIGKVGGGPEEYSQLLGVAVDNENKCILALTVNSTVLLYDYEGVFMKSINIPSDIRTISYSGGNFFMCIVNEYSEQLSSYLITYDYDGKELIKILIENDAHSFERTMQSVPIMYNWEGLKMKFPYNDTIFQYKEKETVSPYKVLCLGKYSPNRELIENASKKNELLRNYAQILTITESEKYFFLRLLFEQEVRGIVVDKEGNKILYNKTIENPRQGGGIENNITGNGQFWPTISYKNNSLIQLVFPVDIKMKDIDEDSNPVIQIVSLK